MFGRREKVGADQVKKILITGANSYIGDSVRDYLARTPQSYEVTVKDTVGWKPEAADFEGFDVVFNVAGIAHIKETKKNRHLYYEINRDLSISIARTAKSAGVKQLILLSTMSVYGMNVGHITKEMPVNPKNAYGRSKAEADAEIKKLEDEKFRFVCLRPPMVYGEGCKGNYQKLRKFALKSPLFPNYKNERSMIFIGNLCEFVKNCIDEEKHGLFFPQDAEYVNTGEMVKKIAEKNGRKIRLTRIFNPAIRILPFGVIKKVFGSLTYEKTETIGKYDFEKGTEGTL